MPYTSQMLNNVSGGWRKSYGTTTGDVNDRFLAVNGATSGSLPFFKQTNLTLVSGSVYTLGFYGKQANSFAQGTTTDAQIVIEVLDNGSTVVSSGSLNLNRPGSYAQDRPETPWQFRFFSFTAPGGSGPFTVQLRASTTAAMGNDFYIDDIALYPCSMGILPLKLESFLISETANDINLTWEVRNVVSGHSDIEYSTDGKNFITIANSILRSSLTNYSFKHKTPGAGIHYYRLKISDTQGNIIYSAIKSLNMKYASSDNVLLYPNPAADRFNIRSTLAVDAIEITDVSGKLIRKFHTGNTHALEVDIDRLTRGVYYIKLINSKTVTLHKIIKQK